MFVDEDLIMPRSFLIKKNSYSHCPLKKRPVQIFKEEPLEDTDKDVRDDISEPENLSTKPEDLSLTSQQQAQKPCSTPPVGVALTTKRTPQPQEPMEQASSHPTLHHPVPTPSQYLVKSGGPLEPLNLNTPADPPHPLHYSAWHRQVASHYPPHYLAAFNYPYPPPAELYHHQYPSSLYPVSPIRHHDQLSPYGTTRESTRSPPSYVLPHRHPLHPATDSPKLFMPYQPLDQCGLSPTSSIASSSSHGAFHSLSPPPATPEDLSSPGSMSSGSSSAGSIGVGKKRKECVAPRYQCPDCAKSYSTYSGLSKHQQFHCAATAGAQAKKSFSCKYCEKVYVSLGALKMHIRTHTLPCKCKLCGKAFSRPWLLQGHIRTHTGEKPFSCQHCNRAFADRSNLRAHLQTHSDVKKYSCVSCSKTFSRMSLLTKHMDGGCPGVMHLDGGCPVPSHLDGHHSVKREDSGDEGHLYP